MLGGHIGRCRGNGASGNGSAGRRYRPVAFKYYLEYSQYWFRTPELFALTLQFKGVLLHEGNSGMGG